MYDPSIGRWLTPDPIGFAGGDVNLYGFVGNAPTNYVDPSGLDKTPSQVTYGRNNELTIKVQLVSGTEGGIKDMPAWSRERERNLHVGLYEAYKMAVKARDELGAFLKTVLCAKS